MERRHRHLWDSLETEILWAGDILEVDLSPHQSRYPAGSDGRHPLLIRPGYAAAFAVSRFRV